MHFGTIKHTTALNERLRPMNWTIDSNGQMFEDAQNHWIKVLIIV
jgi:hypothetical protein